MGNKAPVRLIQDEEVIEWIRQEGAQTYRYEGNTQGFRILLIAGAVSLITAFVVAIFVNIQSNLILAGLFALFTFWSYWTVFHWWLFSLRNYVGLSGQELMIGRGSKAYIIPTSRLNKEAVDVTLMKRGKYTGILPIYVDHLKISVHLYGPFSNLDHLPDFTANVLSYLLGDKSEESTKDESTKDESLKDESLKDESTKDESTKDESTKDEFIEKKT